MADVFVVPILTILLRVILHLYYLPHNIFFLDFNNNKSIFFCLDFIFASVSCCFVFDPLSGLRTSYSCINFSPRSEDNTAAIKQNIAPIMKDVLRAGINAFANVVGNHVVPVIVLRVDCGMVATTEAGKLDSIALTGFDPSSAENNAPAGGILLMIGAKWMAPILVSDVTIASGNLYVIPTISIFLYENCIEQESFNHEIIRMEY